MLQSKAQRIWSGRPAPDRLPQSFRLQHLYFRRYCILGDVWPRQSCYTFREPQPSMKLRRPLYIYAGPFQGVEAFGNPWYKLGRSVSDTRYVALTRHSSAQLSLLLLKIGLVFIPPRNLKENSGNSACCRAAVLCLPESTSPDEQRSCACRKARVQTCR